MYVHWAHAYCDCRYEVKNISYLILSYIARHDKNKNGESVLTIKIQNLHLEFDFVLCTITNHQIMK